MTKRDPVSRSAVLVISSHVIRGAVGNRAAVFALERLGHTVWAFPTVVLPWHPGHGRSTRMPVPADIFTAMADEIIGSPWLAEVDAVLSGYLGHPAQAEAIASVVEAVKAQNSRAQYLCDPVMGDVGGLYVPEEVAAAIRDRLLPLATIATPNRFELSWLAGAPLPDNEAVMDAALSLGPERVLVTSALPHLTGGTGNLLLTAEEALLAEHRVVPNAPNGLGDLLSATFLARQLEGLSDERALHLATGSVFEVLARTVGRGGDELMLAVDGDSIVKPMSMVQLRRLKHPADRRR